MWGFSVIAIVEGIRFRKVLYRQFEVGSVRIRDLDALVYNPEDKENQR